MTRTFLLFALAFIFGCSDSPKKTNPVSVSVSVSPATASVQTGQTKQFTATITGTTNTAVTWSVTGGAANGTISSAGLYTAPDIVPAGGNVVITATAVADATKSATATVTVTAPVVSISVSPTSANVQISHAQQFTATVSNTKDTAVTWSVAGNGCSGTTCGSIDANGLYTAPATVPNPASVTVTATSHADTTKTATATVTIAAPPAVTVAVAPKTATVALGATQKFTATIANSDTGVTWSLSSNSCTGSECGTVDNTGLYTAPKSLPGTTPQAAVVVPRGAATTIDITVIATSNADPHVQDTATVTLTDGSVAKVAVSPGTASVTVKTTQTFTATVTGAADTAVDWTIGDCTGSCGSITADGVYTAPDTVPDPATLTITAALKSDPLVFGTAKVTITSQPTGNNAKLNGHYAFMGNGFSWNGSSGDQIIVAGSFVADGKGNITSGILNGRSVLQTPDVTKTFTGTYSIGDDNRGQLTIGNGQVYKIVLRADGSGGRFIEFFENNDDGERGTGIIEKQETSAFSLSAFKGDYAFMISGEYPTAERDRKAIIGRLTADGTGNFTSTQYNFSAAGYSSSGSLTLQVDDNDHTVSSSGRFHFRLKAQTGSVDLGQQDYAAYIVSADRILLVNISDFGSSSSVYGFLSTGELVKQTGGPYTPASFSGNVVSYSIGRDDSDQTGRESLILAEFDGQMYFSGTLDENYLGTTRSLAGQGKYSVDADGLGHGTITISGMKPSEIFIFAPNKAFVLEGDESQPGNMVQAGLLEPQTATTITGTYTMGWYDEMSPMASWPTGVLTFASDGSVTGHYDQQLSDGTLKADQPFTGKLTLGSDGRGFITISDAEKWAIDVLSPTKFVAIPFGAADPNGAVLLFEK